MATAPRYKANALRRDILRFDIAVSSTDPNFRSIETNWIQIKGGFAVTHEYSLGIT